MADYNKRLYVRSNIYLPSTNAQFAMWWPEDASLIELKQCLSFANFQFGLLIEAETTAQAGEREYESWLPRRKP